MRGARRHRLAPGLLAVDAADRLQPGLIGSAAIGGVRPYVRGGVVGGHHIAQHASVEARIIGDLGRSDEAVAPADGDAALVAEARDGNVDTGPTVEHGPCLGELKRPARVGVLLRSAGRLIGPDLGCTLARLDRVFLRHRVALLGRGHQCGVDDLSAHR